MNVLRLVISYIFIAIILFGCDKKKEVTIDLVEITDPNELAARAAMAKLSTEEIIGKLQEVGQEGTGFHSTAYSRQFMALDEKSEFAGGIIGSYRPQVSPQIRELVRRGVEALPLLLKHISDERSTGLSVGKNGPIMASWLSDEYDCRYEANRYNYSNVNTNKTQDIPFGEEYTLKVGDLCYVIIGQIVNRDLMAVRYQPTSCMVVNSPIETPALAEAVRKDWEGLDLEGHKASLIKDYKESEHEWHQEPAYKRLFFYYPEEIKTFK